MPRCCLVLVSDAFYVICALYLNRVTRAKTDPRVRRVLLVPMARSVASPPPCFFPFICARLHSTQTRTANSTTRSCFDAIDALASTRALHMETCNRAYNDLELWWTDSCHVVRCCRTTPHKFMLRSPSASLSQLSAAPQYQSYQGQRGFTVCCRALSTRTPTGRVCVDVLSRARTH